jgi:hypothetical protein
MRKLKWLKKERKKERKKGGGKISNEVIQK